MIRYVFRRLLGLLPVLLGVSLLSFLLIAMSGKDPAEIIARRGLLNASPETIEALRESLELGGTLPQRYLGWVKGLITGRMGFSIHSYRPIAQDIAEYLPVTLSVVGLSLAMMLLLALPLGLLSARYQNRLVDHILRVLTVLGICIPSFWLGFMLLSRYAVAIPLFTVMPQPGLKGYILPALSLAVPAASSMVRLIRASLLSELSRDYVAYAKTRGLAPARILTRHVLRNALPPMVTVFMQYTGYLLAGAVAVESVFSIKGLGTYLIGCVIASDASSVATCIVLIAMVFVLGNLLADLINRLLCPWMLRESHA